jgi:hypothetical protein
MSYMSEITAEMPCDQMIEQLAESLKVGIQCFDIAVKEARAGEQKQVKEAADYAKMALVAMQQIVTARQNSEKLRQNLGILDPKRELDFDAARSEVGRRLARLRGAGGLG